MVGLGLEADGLEARDLYVRYIIKDKLAICCALVRDSKKTIYTNRNVALVFMMEINGELAMSPGHLS